MRDLVHRLSVPVNEAALRAVSCWGCGTEAAAGDRCGDCGRLQRFPSDADHWGVLGLPRRLVLDRAELESRFHGLSRRLHPDYFRLRSPEEQAISLENSAAVNSAYRMLRDPITRAEYLLGREGISLGATGQSPPADLFEEILEIQEMRQELSAADDEAASTLRIRLGAARAELDHRRAGAEAALAALFPRWDTAGSAERQRIQVEMRGALAIRAYLRTVLRDLGAVLDGGQDGGRTGG